MKKLVRIAAVGLALSAACIYGQDGGPPPGPPGMRGPGHGPGGPGGPFGRLGPGFGPFGKVVTGAPYSADVSSQSVQTLSDGNTVQHGSNGHMARDSAGRTFSQETITGGPFGQQGPVVVTFINDPVAGVAYVLNANTKVATKRSLPKPPSGAPPNGEHHGPRDSANTTTTDLGTQTIAGVSAQGKSVTHTIPAGAIGNAQPIVSTNETWYSPDLQVVVLAKRNDIRMGASTYSLTNIQRAEPAASLFQVPSDYTIQDASAGHGGRFRGPKPPQQ